MAFPLLSLICSFSTLAYRRLSPLELDCRRWSHEVLVQPRMTDEWMNGRLIMRARLHLPVLPLASRIRIRIRILTSNSSVVGRVSGVCVMSAAVMANHMAASLV